ncbi:MAG: hypothetical protein LH473_08935 [Chitinophagales bacterium]|nr:hypothetical protein [Chitinophagales bacterium]
MSNQSKITLQASNDCCASNTMPDGCCKNESRTIKLAVDFRATSVSQLPSLTQHFVSILFGESENLFAGNHNAAALNVCNPHGPPGSPPQGYYILFRTILI